MKRLFNKQAKLIRSLKNVKNRRETGFFVAEGFKAVDELNRSAIETEMLIIDNSVSDQRITEIIKNSKCKEIFSEEINKLSSMKSSEGILAVGKIPVEITKDKFFSNSSDILGLFGISDPGNLGTIVRTALWFGIKDVILFENSADIYSNKVIRSSMGAVFHLNIFRVKSFDQIKKELSDLHKIGTFLDQKHNYKNELKTKFLMLGNEANGLNQDLKKITDCNFRIESKGDFESLNVSVAGGIIMNEIFKRRR